MQKIIFSLTLKSKFLKYMCKRHKNNGKGSQDFERVIEKFMQWILVTD
jgi:hypothetical protein